MGELRLFVCILVAEFQAVCLERLEVRNGRYLQPPFLRFRVDLEVVGQGRSEGHIASAETQDAVGELECLYELLHVGYHTVQCLVALLGQAQLYDLDLVELVQTVQTAYVFTIRAGFAAEAGGVGGHFDREILFVEDDIPIDVRYGNFGRRNQIEVVDRSVVHLSLLVGQLSGTESRSLVYHDRGLYFEVSCTGVVFEEEVDQGTLQTGTLAFVDGESRSGQFDAQVEIDQIVFAGQFPMRKGIVGERTMILHQLDYQVVFGCLAFGNDIGREVRQRDDRSLQGIRNLLELCIQRIGALFESGNLGFLGFGLLPATLTHQGADLFGCLILLCQRFVQFVLDGLAAVVQLLYFVDDGSCIHSLFCQTADGCFAVIPELLDCKHRSVCFVFNEQIYKTKPNHLHICRLFFTFVRKSRHTVKSIELLAPARDLASAIASVDYGADALYMGGARFGARVAAGNTVEQIARAVEYAHQYGVRLYATLNTLLYDGELDDARRQANELIAAGVDALIVQDMALRRMDLPVELHSSTQMYNRTPEQALFLERCGFARVILERALSLAEIRRIRAACQVDLECFVHGAICVGYSGRCFLSRSMSERSGNRGACSQPCRLTYDLVDEKGRTILKGRHLLSVRDMNLSMRVGELIDAGITSFKIEGRLKDLGYIKNVVSYYREQIDRALAVRPDFCRASVGESIPDFRPDPSKSFTRGESEYFFDGRRAGVASFDTPKAVGEFIGRVVRVDARGFQLDTQHDLASGDGICFLTTGGLVGTNVNAVDGCRVQPNRMEGIAVGVEIYRNFDRYFAAALERSRTRRVIPVEAEAILSAERVVVRFTDVEGVSAEVVSEGAFDKAKNPQKMAETIATQLSRSGDTIFDVRRVHTSGEDRFVPVSLLAQLRRDGLEKLREARLACPIEHRILPEDKRAEYPSESLVAEENVTNRLAEKFYRDHGVQRIERGLDLSATTVGHTVMRTAYCIRREIGQCLKRNSDLKGDLFLVRGRFRYRLLFDCAHCEMCLIDRSDRS